MGQDHEKGVGDADTRSARPETGGGGDPLSHFKCDRATFARPETAGQKAAIAAEALPHFEQEAKKRMEAGRPKEGVEKIPQDNDGKARDHAAAQVGVNPRYVSDAKKIKEADPVFSVSNPS